MIEAGMIMSPSPVEVPALRLPYHPGQNVVHDLARW
jgi:hypothetical protein